MPIIEKLNAAFREALADKEVSSKLLAAGIEPETSTPDELRKFQAAETQKWDKIARDAKIEKEEVTVTALSRGDRFLIQARFAHALEKSRHQLGVLVGHVCFDPISRQVRLLAAVPQALTPRFI